MKVKIEIELEIVVTGVKEHKHNTTDVVLLNAVNDQIGTHITNMYIDDIKVTKTDIQ